MKIEKDYEELLKLFNKNKVKYCIVGAYALALYAMPRYTKDMDLFVEPDQDNARKILRALEEFGFKKLGLKEKDFSRKHKIIQLGYEPIRVDILTSIEGCDFEEVWKHKKTFHYGRQKAYFIGRNELVKNKKASRRKQDLADLEVLSKPIKKK